MNVPEMAKRKSKAKNSRTENKLLKIDNAMAVANQDGIKLPMRLYNLQIEHSIFGCLMWRIMTRNKNQNEKKKKTIN